MEDVDNATTMICGRCATVCDLGDKFCRRCGMALTDEQLPLKREQHLPDVWRPRVPALVVRSAAVIAVGALTEIMARRLMREAGRRVANVTRLPMRREPSRLAERFDDDDAHIVSETVFLRRIRAVGRRAR